MAKGRQAWSKLVPRTSYLSHNRTDWDFMRSLLRDPILGCWGTTMDVVTTLLHLCRPCADVCESAKLRPAHSLMLQAHRFLGLPRFRFPSTVPCRIVLLSPELLVTWPYHFSFLVLTVDSRQSYYPISCTFLFLISLFDMCWV